MTIITSLAIRISSRCSSEDQLNILSGYLNHKSEHSLKLFKISVVTLHHAVAVSNHPQTYILLTIWKQNQFTQVFAQVFYIQCTMSGKSATLYLLLLLIALSQKFLTLQNAKRK